jgi:hypothetical protein
MSLLDLLGTVLSPELSPAERSRLRSLLSASHPYPGETPWPSGIIDRTPGPRTEVDVLRERVAELELTVKVLGDLLAERGLLEPGTLPARARALREQLAAQETARREAESAAKRAAEEAKKARTVTCAACGAEVRERESYLSATGPLCGACHLSHDD